MRCRSGRLAPWSELTLLQAKWAPRLPLSGPLLLSYLTETWLRGSIRWSYFSEMSASCLEHVGVHWAVYGAGGSRLSSSDLCVLEGVYFRCWTLGAMSPRKPRF